MSPLDLPTLELAPSDAARLGLDREPPPVDDHDVPLPEPRFSRAAFAVEFRDLADALDDRT